jgi:hypothetical protein
MLSPVIARCSSRRYRGWQAAAAHDEGRAKGKDRAMEIKDAGSSTRIALRDRARPQGVPLILSIALAAATSGCGSQLPVVERTAGPVELPSGEPRSACERKDWLDLVPASGITERINVIAQTRSWVLYETWGTLPEGLALYPRADPSSGPIPLDEGVPQIRDNEMLARLLRSRGIAPPHKLGGIAAERNKLRRVLLFPTEDYTSGGLYDLETHRVGPVLDAVSAHNLEVRGRCALTNPEAPKPANGVGELANGASPATGAGFALGQPPAAAEARCTGAGMVWEKVEGGAFSCNGTPDGLGVPAVVKLTACGDTVCEVAVDAGADGAPWATLLARFGTLARRLVEQHGDKHQRETRALDGCVLGSTSCADSGRVRKSEIWRWADKRRVSLVLDGGRPGGAPSLRIIYSAGETPPER